jgi:hypothetical protein
MPASVTPGCHLLAGGEILVDAVDAHRTRVVERDQNVFGGDVGAEMDRPHRQADRLAVLFQRAGRRVDREGGDVMLGADGTVAGLAVAAGDIEIAVRGVRPGILHAGRQLDRFARRQRHAVHVDVVMRQIGADIGVERDLARCGRARGRRLLRRRQSRRREGGGGHRHEDSAADHIVPPDDAGGRRGATAARYWRTMLYSHAAPKGHRPRQARGHIRPAESARLPDMTGGPR